MYKQFCDAVFVADSLTLPEESVDDLFAKLAADK